MEAWYHSAIAWVEHDFFKLLRLGAGELDYLGPLVGFFRDASCVLAGRQRKHLAAKVGNAWLDRGVSEDGVNLPVERVDDFGGRVLRRADTGPRARLETRYEVAKWWDVGKRLQARRGRHRQWAQPAGPDVFYGGRHIVEHDMHLSGNEIGQRQWRSPIRHMQHVDAGHHFEQLAGHVRDGAVSCRRKTDFARMSLGVGDELRNRLGRK